MRTDGSLAEPPRGSAPGPPAPPPWRRVPLLLLGFVALTALGVAWAAPDRAEVVRIGAQLAGLPAGWLAVLGVLAAAVIGAEMLRLAALGRALGVRVGVRAALDATIANNLFSWLTPGAALGEPAAVVMLGRRGVPWDAAVVISFGKFATSFAVILALGCAFLLLGHGPSLARWIVLPFAFSVGLGLAAWGLLVAGAFWPEAAGRVLEAAGRRLARVPLAGRIAPPVVRTARGAVARLARFRHAGARGWLAIAGSQLAYYAAYVGLVVGIAAALAAPSPAATAPVAVIYLGFLYLAPTPGGAGLAEASAELFFARTVPGGDALTLVLLFRGLTSYLHVLLGLVYLPLFGARAAVPPPTRPPVA